MDASSELNIKNKSYLKSLELFVWQSYQQDLDKGDLTTHSFLGNLNQKVIANIHTNQDGILAGVQEADWFLKKLKIQISKGKKDGDHLKKNDLIMKIQGKASDLLSAERTLLNLLQRMSGVATKTKKLSDLLPKNIKLLATRKTLWGYLDKRAVAVGGGGTHRLNLSDAILIKENHIALSLDFKKSLENAFKKNNQARFIEVELESEEQVKEFLEIYDVLKKKLSLKKNKTVVMLDNFKPAQIKKVIEPLKKRNLFIEISGGINEKNILNYTIKGVDAISCGAITMAAPHLDLSLRI